MEPKGKTWRVAMGLILLCINRSDCSYRWTKSWGSSRRLFGNRVITTRRSVEGGADDRSTFIGCSGATFLVAALVENAIQHGIQSSPRAGRLQLMVRPSGPWLEMRVSDDGQGVPSTEVEQLFFGERPRVHALLLLLLRRRLQGLFGRSFQLEVRSELGEGTTAASLRGFRFMLNALDKDV